MGLDGAGVRFQARYDRFTEKLGSSWVIVETGATFKAEEQPLAPNDMPLVDLEGEGMNINELNPLLLTNIARSSGLEPGQNIHRVDSEDPLGDNYFVESVDPSYFQGVPTYIHALIYVVPRSR